MLLLFNTLRHLRFRQIFYRIYYRCRPLKIRPIQAPPVRLWPESWNAPRWKPACLSTNTFHCLNRTQSIESPQIWNDPKQPKLWLYHLHYFDDLNAVNPINLDNWVQRWINENPCGCGWEPYPLSLRIVNWVQWLKGAGKDNTLILNSLATQAEALSTRLEFHLLGNHLWANAKALVFAGAFFEGLGERWLQRGLALLDRELAQFLPDGGHFERSPMYHAILTWDLCDCIHLAQVSQLPDLLDRVPVWEKTLERAYLWLRGMTHPDGDISFFNDATLGVAPTLASIKTYIQKLCPDFSWPSSSDELQIFPDSGYIRVAFPHGVALIDVGPLGPDFLPGHGHADTLSFELSLYGQRVFVNSGISTYETNADRLSQRGTAAHNTLTINNKDSSEVWSSFRVARRARPQFQTQKTQVVIEASHDGYRRLATKNTHRRSWQFSDQTIEITDSIDGPFETATAYFYLHPAISAKNTDTHVTLSLPNGPTLAFMIDGGTLTLLPNKWHCGFYKSVPNTCLVISLKNPNLRTTLSWK